MPPPTGTPTSPASPLPPGVREIEAPEPREISGVAWLGPGILVVGDDDAKSAWSWPGGDRLPLPEGLDDTESLDVLTLADGSTLRLFLGEQHAVLADDRGGRTSLPASFAETCGRGAEALTARLDGDRIRVVAGVEGGFFTTPCAEPEAARLPRLAFFDWTPGSGAGTLREVALPVPEPGDGSRFRLTDLAWRGEELWALLASARPGAKKPYEHTWLQRLDADGQPLGEPRKLEELWGSYRQDRNWEGLDASPEGWVLGFDAKKGRQFLVLWADEQLR